MAMANAAQEEDYIEPPRGPELTPEQAGVPPNWELLDREIVMGKPHYRIGPELERAPTISMSG